MTVSPSTTALVSQQLDSSIFREYDIRGVVDKDFNEAGIQLLGQAFATTVFERTGGNTLGCGF